MCATDQRLLWFQGWRAGERSSFESYLRHLRRRWWRSVFFFVERRSRFYELDAEDVTETGFQQAMEEVDLGVSGGIFMTHLGTIGRCSGRKLNRRNPIAWHGGNQFDSLARQTWMWRAQGQLPRPAAQAHPVFLHITSGVEEDRRAGSADAIADANDRQRLAEAEELVEWVRFLASLSTQLRRKRALTELLEATIWHVKHQIARCSPCWREASLETVCATSVEDLIDGADLTAFVFDGAEWRQFMLEVLGLGREALDQRVHRLREEVVWINRGTACADLMRYLTDVQSPARECRLESASQVVEFGDFLEALANRLKNKPASRLLVEKTIVFVKNQLGACTPAAPPDCAAVSIRHLVRDARPGEFRLDRRKWREAVAGMTQETLSLDQFRVDLEQVLG